MPLTAGNSVVPSKQGVKEQKTYRSHIICTDLCKNLRPENQHLECQRLSDDSKHSQDTTFRGTFFQMSSLAMEMPCIWG